MFKGGQNYGKLVVFVFFVVGLGHSLYSATLIGAGSNWRYLDNGSNQGTAWKKPNFVDTTWKSGPAEFGYGDGGEATTVDFGPNPSNKYITTYFRRKFNINDVSNIGGLTVNIIRDDGAIVYINGIEVVRTNMPSGPITHTTQASGQANSANGWNSFEVSPSRLRNGVNVIAVEIHQFTRQSLEISFDLELTASLSRGSTLVNPGSSWRYLDDGTDQGTAWKEPDFDDALWNLGNAELGYGDGDESTVIRFGPMRRNKFITTYFRHEFSIDDVSSIGGLTANIVRDDGAIVYINGIEVIRTNMPSGPITFTTHASRNARMENSWHSFEIAPTSIQNGNNVIAVEVHQRRGLSSDLSFDLELLNSSNRVKVVRGPYLQRSSPGRMTVRWRTDVAVNSVINYGVDLANLDQISSLPRMTREHSVTLTRLLPDTKYYYLIGSSAEPILGGSNDFFFRTHPLAGTTKPTRVWVLGDSGKADNKAALVRNAYQNFVGSNPADLLLMLGDNAYDNGTQLEYQKAVFDIYPNVLRNTVLWPTLGNHDARTADSSTLTGPYYQIFSLPTNGQSGGLPSGTEAYYSFDYANIHFVCLDSHDTDRSSSGAMANWLDRDLGATTQEWIIAFWHHPPFSKGFHDSDVDVRLVEMRTVFVPILEDHGVDLVLSGHNHSYERSFLIDGHYGLSSSFDAIHVVDGGDGNEFGDGAYQKITGPHGGAVYTVAGSSGSVSKDLLDHPAMAIGINELGSLILDINGSRLDVSFLNNMGEERDSFTILH